MSLSFEELMRRQMAYFRIPGITAALVHGNETKYYSFGVKDLEAGDTPANRVDPQTLFTLASVSKSFNAALIARLVDEGILDWDRPVRAWVPEMRMFDRQADEHMCLRDMLCHRTGLADHDAMWPSEEGHARMAAGLRFLEPNLDFRQRYQYNNTVYVMAGYLAEAATGKPWHQLLREYILEPLGMSRTCSRLQDMVASGNFAEPHKFCHGRVRRVERWPMDEAAAAAGVNSCAEDMARWLRFHLRGGVNDAGVRLISEKNFAEMHTVQIAIPGEGEIPSPDEPILDGYAFGWRQGTYRGRRYWVHTGHIEGYLTIQSLLPDEDIGVFISMNIHDGCSQVHRRGVYTLLDSLLGYECDRTECMRRGEHCADWLYTDNHQDYIPLATFPCDREFSPSALSGTYVHPGYGTLRVLEEEGRLFVSYHFRRDELIPLQGSTWYAEEFMEDTRRVRMPFEFLPDETGSRVTALRIPIERTVAPVIFEKLPCGTDDLALPCR